MRRSNRRQCGAATEDDAAQQQKTMRRSSRNVVKLVAAKIGFDDEFIYREVPLPPETCSIPGLRLQTPQSHVPFAEWARQDQVLKIS
jgi:hypothetical protein